MKNLYAPYLQRVKAEIREVLKVYPLVELDSVYLGGGTPSLVDPALLEDLFEEIEGQIGIAQEAEVTVEANPLSVDYQNAIKWRDVGINRVSLGIQGFDPDLLAILGRKGDSKASRAAYENLREAGFTNINIDLIFGVPGQDEVSWSRTLERAIELQPEHISTYCLTYEPNTLLYKRWQNGEIDGPDPDREYILMESGARILEAAGYKWYEISNFAKDGFFGRHNLAYWDAHSYIGVGCGAHSCVNFKNNNGITEKRLRYWNVGAVKEYIAEADIADDFEVLDNKTAAAEHAELALRTIFGINLKKFESQYGSSAAEQIKDVLEHARHLGLVELENSVQYRPTRKGYFLNNQIGVLLV